MVFWSPLLLVREECQISRFQVWKQQLAPKDHLPGLFASTKASDPEENESLGFRPFYPLQAQKQKRFHTWNNEIWHRSDSKSLWSYHEHLPGMGCGLVTGGRMDHTHLFLPPKGEWPREGHPKALTSGSSTARQLFRSLDRCFDYVWEHTTGWGCSWPGHT